MTDNSFAVLLQFVTGIIIPFAVMYLQRVSWKSYYKFGLAAALSIIVATLMGIVDGTISPKVTLQNFATILTISQTVYHTFFKGLNLHAGLFPEDVLVNKSKESVATSIEAMIDKELAKNIIDNAKPEQLIVSVDIKSAEG